MKFSYFSSDKYELLLLKVAIPKKAVSSDIVRKVTII